MATGTFASSLSRRSAVDQGIVIGLATGLRHLLERDATAGRRFSSAS